MKDWVPNPHARPYVPRKRSKLECLYRYCVSPRSRCSWICKVSFILVLAVTLTLNISFILNSNTDKKLLRDSAQYRNDQTAVSYNNVYESTEILQKSIRIEVFSNRSLVYVKVDSKSVLYNNDTTDKSRGIHVVVLNQATGEAMATRQFDTYQEGEDTLLSEFVDKLSPHRILVFTIKDEGTYNLKKSCRKMLSDLGSQHAETVAWRDTWAFVTVRGDQPYSEDIGKAPAFDSWGRPLYLKVNMKLKPVEECQSWPKTDSGRRLRRFCSKYDGYGVCNCDKPPQIDFPRKPLPDGGEINVAVSVIASNRPHYLFRMLKTLLQTPGVPVPNVTVFIDGFYDEARDVAHLFNVKGIQHTPHGVRNSRISQHYKGSITATFELFPQSEYIILIEEDLDLSPDFFYFFKQTLPILEQDPTLYCISAWNDQGYNHSSKDPSLLYRIETMPGLGWMMKKSLFMNELLPQWPSVDKGWDWDMWMRHNMIRKDRECIIPDISRTYHFGSKGLNINPYFQKLYFQNHSFQTQPNVKLKDIEKMKAEEYEKLVEDLIKNAKVLDHSMDPCGRDFIPNMNADTFVMYINMNTTTDFITWKQIAKCYRLWDLDVRGFHKSMWRQFHKDKHLVIVGVPASPYAKFKPAGVKPIYLEDKTKKLSETNQKKPTNR